MSLSSTVTTLSEPLLARWRNVSATGQRLLALLAIVASLLIFWAYAWLPVSRARDDLRARGAGWDTQLVEMRALAGEAKRLQQIAPIAAKEPTRTLADRAALQALFGPETKVADADGRSFHLSVANVKYAQWLERLDLALAKHRLKLVSLKLRTVSAPAEERTAIAAEWVLADEQ